MQAMGKQLSTNKQFHTALRTINTLFHLGGSTEESNVRLLVQKYQQSAKDLETIMVALMQDVVGYCICLGEYITSDPVGQCGIRVYMVYSISD